MKCYKCKKKTLTGMTSNHLLRKLIELIYVGCPRFMRILMYYNYYGTYYMSDCV